MQSMIKSLLPTSLWLPPGANSTIKDLLPTTDYQQPNTSLYANHLHR
jgi:hypothetical protein